MKDYDPVQSFTGEAAAIYDDEPRGDEDEAVAFLAGVAGEGPALELAIGTGRLALPLAAHGVRVDGIDLSADLLSLLRAKPGGSGVSLVHGDLCDVDVNGSYRLVYIAYNSLFNVLEQADQVRCFRNVAEHLQPDGRFVVEAFDPAFLHRLRDGQYVDAESVGTAEVWLDVARHDPVLQRLDETHVRLTTEGVKLYPVVCRYAWPAELDLMAQLAGLRLVDRFGGWSSQSFTADSRQHVSVYGF